jgi:hypothetical protein
MDRRGATRILAATAAVVLGGCAAMGTVSSEVSSFGEWPSGRAVGTFAFERLPSQQARTPETERLEALARPALEKAGFKPAPEGQQPDVLVQIGVRATRSDRGPWDDPLWWPGGFGVWRQGPWPGPGWGWTLHAPLPRYEREVAVLIRDRASGKPLFEARASNEGTALGDATLIGAMFRAALADFPQTGINPRTVRIELGR